VKLLDPLFADIWDKEEILDNWKEGLIAIIGEE
jgi:hypothetical protein